MERTWRSRALTLGVLLACAMIATSCAPGRAQPTPKPRPVARIGAALSLSGAARMAGNAQRSGIKLAQDEINNNHLIGDTRLEVICADDGSARDQASTVFQTFIETDHVVAIIGPTLSDSALSVDPLAQQAGVPVLAISNAASGVTQIGNFIFRDSLTESQATPRILKALKAHLDLRSAALLYLDTDPNRSGAETFNQALERNGVRISAEQTFSKEQTDYSAQLEAIADSHPDALFVIAPSSAAAAILIQARQHGLDRVPIVGSNAFNSDAVLRGAGAAAEGLIVGSAWTIDNPSTRNQQFIQSYRARYGVDPDQVAAQAYTGVYLLATALSNAGTVTDSRALRDALEQIKGLETPLGPFSFNASRDPDYAATVQTVRLGRFVPY